MRTRIALLLALALVGLVVGLSVAALSRAPARTLVAPIEVEGGEADVKKDRDDKDDRGDKDDRDDDDDGAEAVSGPTAVPAGDDDDSSGPGSGDDDDDDSSGPGSGDDGTDDNDSSGPGSGDDGTDDD